MYTGMTEKGLGFVLALVVGFVAGAVGAAAQNPGDLLVTPTRALFENGKRNEVLTLINRGSDTATYRMSMIQYRMTPDGRLEQITEPEAGQLFAGDLIRFFPREVTIAPGESQNVRVQLRIPVDLPEGEYRSHLYFRSVPKAAPLAATEDSAIEEFSVKLTAIYGVSIPMIVRNGKLNAEVSIRDLTLTSDSTSTNLTMTFDRSGTRSVYGTVRIDHLSESGERTTVGGIAGVAVYTPNLSRSLTLPLSVPENVNLHRGRLIVTYESPADQGPDLPAQETLELK